MLKVTHNPKKVQPGKREELLILVISCQGKFVSSNKNKTMEIMLIWNNICGEANSFPSPASPDSCYHTVEILMLIVYHTYKC